LGDQGRARSNGPGIDLHRDKGHATAITFLRQFFQGVDAADEVEIGEKMTPPGTFGVTIGQRGTVVAQSLHATTALGQRVFARFGRAQTTLRTNLHQLALLRVHRLP